jgi:predicted deacylase
MPPTARPYHALIAGVLGAMVVVVGALVWFFGASAPVDPTPPETATTTPPTPPPWQTMSVIGTSVEGRAIEAHTYGTGSTSILFVGGIHGGYEWNSSLLAYEVMDTLATTPEVVPQDLTIHIIPVLNPDGLATVVPKPGRFTIADIPDPTTRVAAGRFNARSVDLNRNFDCKWQPSATWRGQAVSPGTSAFSEPEAVALRDYVTVHHPRAVIFWHSKAGNVYASECENGILPETLTLMGTYATVGGYGQVEKFDAYPVVGDAEGWLASIGIPAVTVELTTHNTSEFTGNWAAVQALFTLYTGAE